MKNQLLMLTVALSCTFAGSAMAMTKAEYKTGNDRISADYKVNLAKCGSLKANAKDICVSEAKGAEKVAKAELEAQYEPTPRHHEKVGMAKADAAYDTAKEKCDDFSGNAKDVCVKDAKAAHVKGKEEAKVARVAEDTSKAKTEKMSDAKKDASAENRDAQYAAAKERCDSLAGAVKDGCVNDAKAKYGMK